MFLGIAFWIVLDGRGWKKGTHPRRLRVAALYVGWQDAK
jgi:hypothetical protein